MSSQTHSLSTPAARRDSLAAAAILDSAPASAASSVDVSSLDPQHDARPLDANVVRLCVFSRRCARCVRAHSGALVLAKVTLGDATRLDALADELTARESEWQSWRNRASRTSIADVRDGMVERAVEIRDALATFVPEGHPTHQALDELVTPTNDDSREVFTSRVLGLATRHGADLAGTEVTAARLAECAALLEQFRDVRAGARTDSSLDRPTTSQQLSAQASRAFALRSRVYWALALLYRTVTQRARFRFRHDPVTCKLFGSYLPPAKKKAASARGVAAKPAPTASATAASATAPSVAVTPASQGSASVSTTAPTAQGAAPTAPAATAATPPVAAAPTKKPRAAKASAVTPR